MLRYTKLPPGDPWIAEYGGPDVPEERGDREILALSEPEGTASVHPRVFFLTSTADDRVHPGHARKMAGADGDKGYPFLFYEELEGGHGAATNQKSRAVQLAMQYVYLTRQLGGK